MQSDEKKTQSKTNAKKHGIKTRASMCLLFSTYIMKRNQAGSVDVATF